MDPRYCIDQLARNGDVIAALVATFPPEVIRWRPQPDEWSVIEVVCHLLDEEQDDFRARLRHLLSGDSNAWPSNDPERWVLERRYRERDLAETLAAFAQERAASLRWLRELSEVNWDVRYRRQPQAGLSAGDLLVSWAAHDKLHLRQLVELSFASGIEGSVPYRVDYAGEW